MSRRKTAKRAARSQPEPIVPVHCSVTYDGHHCLIGLELNPAPASRPRVTRWGTYYLPTYQRWMDTAIASLPAAEAPLLGALRLEATFGVRKPKSSKLSRPKGDIDNYLKGIMDVLTKQGYWRDDSDVTVVHAAKAFAPAGHCIVRIIGERA